MNDRLRNPGGRKSDCGNSSPPPGRSAEARADVCRDDGLGPQGNAALRPGPGNGTPRSTASVTRDRVDELQRLILEGNPNSSCVAFARQQWGVSRSQGYRLIQKAWAQIVADLEGAGCDRRQLLAWCVSQLQAAVGVALKQKNPGAVVGACRELDALCGLSVNSHVRHHRGA